MKKLILNTSTFQKGEILTRAQLKKVLGGDDSSGSGAFGTCTVTVNCGAGSISCSGTAGRCKRGGGTFTEKAYVQCDNDPKVVC